MNISGAIQYGTKKIRPVDVLFFLQKIMDRDRSFLYAHGETELSPVQEEEFIRMVSLRESGMPAAYIAGFKEFMSMRFKVNGSVLIPRPETEELVGLVIQRRSKSTSFAILDIGTGSGCIAIGLAAYFTNAKMTAVDISKDALCIAAENAFNNGTADRIRFLKADLTAGLHELGNEKFDIVVSNPPYIQTGEIGSLEPEVAEYEPRTALDGGMDGLVFLRAIAGILPELIKKDGLAVIEIGYDQAKEAAEIFKAYGEKCSVLKDFSGKDRFVLIDLA